MSLLSELDLQDSGDLKNYNTGTLFDLHSGRYVEGVDGHYYLDGGLVPHVNAIVGPNGAFKSTVANTFVMRGSCIYNGDVLILDTENSIDKDKERAYHMAEELYDPLMEERVRWIKGIDYTLGKCKDKNLETEDFYNVIKEICNLKETHRKEYLKDSPFIDLKTGKPMKLWVPTYIFVDSLTELTTAIEEDALNGTGSNNFSDTNTVAMADGNKKTLFIHAMRKMCQKYGIVFVVTGHFDKVVQMDMYNPTPKDTTFSLRDYKTKGCGSKLKFLASIYARTSASLLLDSSKEPLYGVGSGPSRDVMEIDITLERCKTANAGEITPFVATQSNGLMNAVTNYHYLRLNNYYGLNGNKQKQQVAFMPDLSISRNTIRELASANAQLRRALEITAQYCYIKNNWNTTDYPYDFSIDPQGLFDKLNSDKNKSVISDILNTRGYWTFTGDSELPYMDVFRVMELAGATKKLN